ncbi:MAG TPA: CAP domain-containing protein [Baekduia sp.]|uniref:CAP domain-containing protein n=1 Tax=Baekduia sp. TaxID=2600305 RepID=UPI002D777A33|nr:CAP domain-containing protein [Baekduia sp.]HET6509383.1 CAP domain-containing protein [Baekduia sp.]
MPRPLRLLAPLTAASAVLALAAPAAHAAPCPDADVSASAPGAVSATLCLLNKERTSRGLGSLSESSTLDKAADRFAGDMVARRFFDHVSPGGGTFMDRIKAAGWTPSGSWTAGENIAWGTGSLSTPASIVDGWMHSPGHRANILNGAFTQIGIGIADGAPRGGVDDGGTYVTDFTGGGAAKKRAKRASARRAARR